MFILFRKTFLRLHFLLKKLHYPVVHALSRPTAVPPHPLPLHQSLLIAHLNIPWLRLPQKDIGNFRLALPKHRDS